MNNIEIITFGGLKKYFPSSTQLQIQPSVSIQELIELLITQKPEAQNLLTICQVAVNEKIANRHDIIPENCKLALLPPFSGG
jgi:molybdopterin converting factor small subunit